MKGSGRTAWRAHRAAAQTTALVAVLAASGLAAGAAPASGAQDTAAPGASLIYRCGFPSGTRPVQVTVRAVLPAGTKTAKPIQPTAVSLTMALPPAAVSGLAALPPAAVSAHTRLTVSASEGPSGTSVVWPGSTRRPVPRPSHGGLTLTTAGTVPPVTVSPAGEVILTAAGLSIAFTAGQAAVPAPGPARSPAPAASGTATAPGGTAQAPLLANCTLAPGQHAALGAVVVTGKAHRAAQRRAAVTTGKCPKLPPGGLKLNPRFPPPPHPPPTFEAHSPSQGCAITTGYADVRKLNGAALIAPALTNVELTVTALQNTNKNVDYFELDNVAQLDFHGLHQFPPSTATFLTFGFVPTTATIELIEHGTINIFAVGPAGIQSHCRPNRWRTCDNIAKAYSRLSVRVVPGSVKVNGVTLDVGSHCETPQFDAVLTGSSATNPPYFVQFGGPLLGTVTIPKFKNCGVTENLDPIFNAAISGPQNFNLLTQGAVCFVQDALGCDKNGLPVPPQPLRKVTG